MSSQNDLALFECIPSNIQKNSYVRYASVVGSLMYAMVRTRLELAQTVSEVSRYMGMFSIQLC